MKVAVLGAGIVGLTTAYCLAKAGHEVAVIERQPGPALETSFANAGQISPAMPRLGRPRRPREGARVAVRQGCAPSSWGPCSIWRRTDGSPACFRTVPARYAENKSRMLRLAEYSRGCLNDLECRDRHRLRPARWGPFSCFEHRPGSRALPRTSLSSSDLACRTSCWTPRAASPPNRRLPRRASFAGGLRLTRDQTGDCYLFATSLATRAAQLGVVFRYSETIEAIERNGDRVSAVRTSRGTLAADHYVVALGSFTPAMVRQLGLRLPVYPVKGYSITAPLAHADRAPQSTVLDDDYKVAITRLGDRIRVGGMAESRLRTGLPPPGGPP